MHSNHTPNIHFCTLGCAYLSIYAFSVVRFVKGQSSNSGLIAAINAYDFRRFDAPMG